MSQMNRQKPVARKKKPYQPKLLRVRKAGGEKVYALAKLERMVRRGQVSEKVIEKILVNWGESNVDDSHWHEYLTDDVWPQALDQIGFSGVKIYFSGFWSQGDGACFICESVDVETLLTFLLEERVPSECIAYDAQAKTEDFRSWLLAKAGYKLGEPCRPGDTFETLLPLIENVKLSLRKISNHYSHSKTVMVDCEADLPDPEYAMASQFGEFVDGFVEDLADQLYQDLEEEYESARSEEVCRDQILDSDATFNIRGRQINA